MSSDRAANTRQAILRSARACFAERGLAATTTREIARRAGVTQPLLHHYFGSKDALFDAVIEASVQDYDAIQSEQWQRSSDDLRFWTVGLVVLFRWLGQHADLLRLGAWARLEGKDRYGRGYAAVFDRVRGRLESGQAAGIIRQDVDIDATLLLIDAMFKGFWERHALYAAEHANPSELERRFLAQALRTLLDGLLAPEAAAAARATLPADLL
ncbi:MAG: TetR family transcriptional regulator [Pseudomonadota bacterium]